MTQTQDRPESVATSFEDLMAKVGAVALDTHGRARKSRWNGQWEVSDGPVTTATAAGAIRLTRAHERALRGLFESPGQQRSQAVLEEQVQAFTALLREHCRLFVRPGEQPDLKAVASTTPWGRVSDYGVAELWAFKDLPQAAEQLGLDALSPGFSQAGLNSEYPREFGAAVGMGQQLQREWRSWSSEQITEQLSVLPSHQVPAWISTALQSSKQLQFLSPERAEGTIESALRRQLTDQLDRIGEPAGDTDTVYEACVELGQGAIAGTSGLVDQLAEENQNDPLLTFLRRGAGEAALRVARGEQNAHSGALRDTTPAESSWLGGVANWNGTMTLNDAYVVEPLRDLFADPGRERNQDELFRIKSALAVKLHELGHFIIPGDEHYPDSAEPFGSQPWVRRSEEGWVNAWTNANLNPFIVEAGLGDVPGLLEADFKTAYPELTGAAAAMAAGLDERSGQEGQALQQMAAESPRSQWDHLVGMVYEASELGSMDLSETRQQLCREEISDSMRGIWAWLDENTGPQRDRARTEAMSALRGEQALAAGLYAANQIANNLRTYAGVDGLKAQQLASAGVAPVGSAPRAGSGDRGKPESVGSTPRPAQRLGHGE